MRINSSQIIQRLTHEISIWTFWLFIGRSHQCQSSRKNIQNYWRWTLDDKRRGLRHCPITPTSKNTWRAFIRLEKTLGSALNNLQRSRQTNVHATRNVQSEVWKSSSAQQQNTRELALSDKTNNFLLKETVIWSRQWSLKADVRKMVLHNDEEIWEASIEFIKKAHKIFDTGVLRTRKKISSWGELLA